MIQNFQVLYYYIINSTKPINITPDPVEISQNMIDMIDVDLPSDNVEKPITVATSEFMNEELEWRKSEEEVEEE